MPPTRIRQSTLSTLSAYYIELAATWGTNSSSNTITCYGYTVLGT